MPADITLAHSGSTVLRQVLVKRSEWKKNFLDSIDDYGSIMHDMYNSGEVSVLINSLQQKNKIAFK